MAPCAGAPLAFVLGLRVMEMVAGTGCLWHPNDIASSTWVHYLASGAFNCAVRIVIAFSNIGPSAPVLAQAGGMGGVNPAMVGTNG